jgi:uncharacterized phage protein (TIGR02220 family)
MSKEKGWLKVWRDIQDTKDWKEKPYTRGQAWIDLLLRANWEETPITKWERGILIKAPRGCFIASTAELAKIWGWSRSKVERFFTRLKTEEQIEEQIEHQKIKVSSVFSIVNWEKYQGFEHQNEHQNEHQTNIKRTSNPTPLLGIKYIREEVKEEEDYIVEKVLDYLNEKLGTAYRSSTASTSKAIKARLKEKYTLDDFKKVIDVKVSEWKGTEYAKFLRPKTLFIPSNFESYLNQSLFKQKDSLGNRYHNENRTLEDLGAYGWLEQTDKDGNVL